MPSIIVTGAAGGIGIETVRALAVDGVSVLCVDIDDRKLDQLLEQTAELPGQRIAVRSTLNSPDACRKVVASTTDTITGFIHLAGVFDPDINGLADMDIYHRAIEHNLTNGYTMGYAVAERIKDTSQASFVFTSSLAFRRGAREYVAYSAAKGGLVGVTRAMSRQLAPNIRVNAVAPGLINTSMPARIVAARGDSLTDEIPLNRMGEAAEVASVIAFLMSDGASYITGQTINVDGGIING